MQLQVRTETGMGDEQNKLSLILNNLSHRNGPTDNTSTQLSSRQR